jgi:hypothetical protein
MAALSLNDVRAVIETHLLAGFGADVNTEANFTLISESGITIVTESPEATATPIAFANLVYKPTPRDSYLQCTVEFDATQYITLGDSSSLSNRLFGDVIVNIFTPAGIGVGQNYDLANKVCSLFTRQILSDIQFQPLTGPNIIYSSNVGSFFQTQVVVPFNVFETL